ncbi:uncharacterized protein LOC110620329 [Manihot esculenta]|uniref:Uncharacterized protein n=2 Tax=Manihot esculenta TaxID=3983 RepID=A0ACB7HC58_MANES|nr:uncharacterized protein LOC110620329 [Manihot esculenta]KAG8648476.1 hypothetical protein MANES_08G002100v8 [Manihot esculenta]
MVESHYLTLLWIWDKRVAKIHWLRSSHSCDQITGAFFNRILLSMQMDMQAHLSYSFSSSRVGKFSPPSFSNYYPLRPFCSRDQKSRDPNPDGGDNGDKFSTDWDKAWSNFRKQGKKTLFSQFSPNKYVSWNPRRSDYPLSEEVDPIKRTERSNLMLWTSPRFTLVGAILVVTFLLVYTILYPIK